MPSLTTNALVLYKREPARVLALGEKIEIETRAGKLVRVRVKDVQVLHPGPVTGWSDFSAERSAELEETWTLLEGETTTLIELAELLFGESMPATVWAAWEHLIEGLWFVGTPESISARDAAEIAAERAAKAAAEAEAAKRNAFLARAKKGNYVAEDARYLVDVERLADGRSEQSKVMAELGRKASPENAHALLLRLGHWDEKRNPHPYRCGVAMRDPEFQLPGLEDEARHDLTHMNAYAIDDAGNQDPDDAIALVDGKLWVHIADVGALVGVDGEIDVEARARGANLYLPEGIVHMLPPAITHRLGLGLSERSPALSIGIELASDGSPTGCDVTTSWVRVQRLSYEEADTQLASGDLAALHAALARFRQWRLARGAVDIQLPEIKLCVHDGEVSLQSLPRLQSREMVADAMLMAGMALAQYAETHVIPLPFAAQPAPDLNGLAEMGDGLTRMFATRKRMQRAQLSTVAAPHGGLGLPSYVQATSPLRRYLDLVVHQQLRAHLAGRPLLDAAQIADRIIESRMGSGAVRKAESLSNRHWSLAWLLQNPDWTGDGVVVERDGGRAKVLVPALAMEKSMSLPTTVGLDEIVQLLADGVDLVQQTAHFMLNQAVS
jgi:exoribonuclease-2